MRGLAPPRRRARRGDWLRALVLGLAIGGGGAAFVASPAGLALEETVGLSWLFLVRGPVEPPPEVAVVALDKRSAEALALPPQPRRWPRTVQARAIAALDRAGASAIAVDLILSERTTPAQDAALATAIAEAGRVVLFQQLERLREMPTIGAADVSHGLWMQRSYPPIPELAAAAAASAPFPLPKVGAGVRQFWTFKREAGDVPTLPAVALQLHALDAYQQWINALEADAVLEIGQVPFLASGLRGSLAEVMRATRGAYRSVADLADAAAAPQPDTASDAGTGVRRQADPRLVDAITGLYAGPDSHYLNFYGPAGTIPVIPVARLLAKDGEHAAPDLAGKVVFLGVAELDDPGQPDGFYSVFTRSDGVDLSGVEIAATAFANMLTGRSLKPVSAATAAAVTAGVGLAIGTAAFLLPALVVVPSAVAAAALYALGAQVAFNRAELWLPLATPLLLQVPLALFLGVLGQYMLAQRQRRRMTQAISYYLPEKVAAELRAGAVTAPEDRGETVYATCLASDLENFTALAETMSPEAVARYLNAYFAAVAEPIKRHGADVLEFRADGIMCAWTAPGAMETAHAKACQAALEVIRAVRGFGTEEGRQPVPTRLGIHAGRIFVGHAGGGGRYAYSIIGDIANTASRIEGLNKLIGTSLLVSEAVAASLEGFLLRPVGRFRLRGKLAPIGVIEVMARMSEAPAAAVELCDRFAPALAAFQEGRREEAEAAFAALVRDYPLDGPSVFYLHRSLLCIEEPAGDADWATIRVDAK